MYDGGFLSCPDNPVTRDEILSGRYGKRPKRILEKHPDANFYCYRPLFHCSCGNLSDKDAVSIGDIKPLCRPSMKCDLCGRKMWEITELPDCLPCPKCGEQMMCKHTMMWD